MKTIYVPFRNSDQTEGRGVQIPYGFAFDSSLSAEQFHNEAMRKDKYLIGLEMKPFDLFHTLDEMRTQQENDLRESARKKLTPEEIKALGL